MTNLLPNEGYTHGKPEYAKSMPALGTTQDMGIPVEQVGPLRVTEDGIEGTFQIVDAGGASVLSLTPVTLHSVSITTADKGLGVISLDDLSTDPVYDGLFHRQGCSIQRNDRCICEYLGQWDA